MARDPSRETYQGLSRAYDAFNVELFDKRLPPCLITLRARGRTFGYFSPDRFTSNGVHAHEIALNPEHFGGRTIEATLSTLVHEMVHLDQYLHRDPPPRRSYHDQDFCDRMQKVGLITSSTGRPGGDRIGITMSHYIDAASPATNPFLKVARKIIDADFKAQWGDRFIKDIRSEWTAGKPALLPADIPAEQVEARLALAIAAAASPMSREPEPVDPEKARQKKLRELSLTAQPGGTVPALARNPGDFVIAEPRRPSVPRDPSKTKFSCPTCRVSAWGKPALNLVCGACMVRLRTQEELDAMASAASSPDNQVHSQARDAGDPLPEANSPALSPG